ncbi:hypothetical protein C8R44DRAFT_752356 [Mycena epipterygia]|nr:hypothetical protein C8R44DRAFT_752356 [Mycena epipterygia]
MLKTFLQLVLIKFAGVFLRISTSFENSICAIDFSFLGLPVNKRQHIQYSITAILSPGLSIPTQEVGSTGEPETSVVFAETVPETEWVDPRLDQCQCHVSASRWAWSSSCEPVYASSALERQAHSVHLVLTPLLIARRRSAANFLRQIGRQEQLENLLARRICFLMFDIHCQAVKAHKMYKMKGDGVQLKSTPIHPSRMVHLLSNVTAAAIATTVYRILDFKQQNGFDLASSQCNDFTPVQSFTISPGVANQHDPDVRVFQVNVVQVKQFEVRLCWRARKLGAWSGSHYRGVCTGIPTGNAEIVNTEQVAVQQWDHIFGS